MAFPPALAITDAVTIFRKTWGDAYDADVLSALKDTTSGGGAGSARTPAQTTAEVIDARDGEASLLAKLGAMETAFTGVGPGTLAQSWHRNLVGDAEHLIWPAGDALAPVFATLSGAGAAVARTGAGLADTQAPEFGLWCVKITPGGGAAAQLSKTVIPASLIARFLGLSAFVDASANEPKFTAIARVKCATTDGARIALDTGAGTYNSNQHTGGGSWETLVVQAPFTDAATKLDVSLIAVAGGSAAYYSPLSCYLSPVPITTAPVTPAMFMAGEWRRTEQVIHLAGAQTASGTVRKWSLLPRRPCIVTDVQLLIETAPTGQALKVDLQTWDGAAWTSMFSTLPEIAAGAFAGGAQPDGTYKLRCLTPMFGASIAANSACRVMVTQVGSGAAGSDLTIVVGALEPTRPVEQFYSYNTL